MSRNKQFAAVVILSSLIALEGFFLSDAPSKAVSFFTTPAKRTQINPSRTLRPDGQTEPAVLIRPRTISIELGAICPDLDTFLFFDSPFICPTEQTARLILKRAFRKLEDVYVPEAYDCDDNALELMMLLRKEALIEYREFPAALAIGFAAVHINGPIDGIHMVIDSEEFPVYHAMPVMRLKTGKWLLIEPLSHQVCELTGPIFEGTIWIDVLIF